MKGRDNRGGGGGGAPPTDLLVCFPSRAHLSLMPKPICSPARPSDPNKRHLRQPSYHLRQPSPMLWGKNKSMGADISEPTSPKVTCAGQIKVRAKPSSCKNWQSVMEEIERIHNNKKNKKRPHWIESFGLKKETMQFLTCLRSIKFNFSCFGSFPASDITTDDEDDDDDDDVDDEEGRENCHEDHMGVGVKGDDGKETSETVFPKWFMVLQENGSSIEERFSTNSDDELIDKPAIPPPNALLLMRCRSAPVKNWLHEKEEEDEETEEEAKVVEKNEMKKQSLVVLMQNDTDFYKCSTDIVKETWVVGSRTCQLSRSRSWKR